MHKFLNIKFILITLIIIVLFVDIAFLLLTKNKKQDKSNTSSVSVSGMIFQQVGTTERSVSSTDDAIFYKSDLLGKNQEKLFEEKGRGSIASFAPPLSPDGKKLVYSPQTTSEVKIYDLTRKQTQSLPFSQGVVKSIVWSRDSINIFVHVSSQEVGTEPDSVYKINTNNLQNELVAQFTNTASSDLNLYGINKDEQTLYIISGISPDIENKCYIYEVNARTLKNLFNNENCIFSPGLKNAVVITRTSGVPKFDTDVNYTGISLDWYSLDTNKKTKTLITLKGQFISDDEIRAIFSPDGKMIAYNLFSEGRWQSVDYPQEFGKLTILNLESLEKNAEVNDILFPEGWGIKDQILYQSSKDYSYYLYNLETKQSKKINVPSNWSFVGWAS